MDKRGIRKLYDSLDGRQRFQLAVEAQARGDWSERNHLIGTCQTGTRRVRDPGFTGAVKTLMSLVGAFVAGCGPLVGQLELLDLIDTALATVDHAVSGGPHEHGETSLPVLEAAREHAERALGALVGAFVAVCRSRVGLEAEPALRVFAPGVWEVLDGRVEGLPEPEAEMVEQAEEALSEVCG